MLLEEDVSACLSEHPKVYLPELYPGLPIQSTPIVLQVVYTLKAEGLVMMMTMRMN